MNRKELIEKRSINTKVFENQRAVCHVHPVPGFVWRLAFLCRVLSSPGPD